MIEKSKRGNGSLLMYVMSCLTTLHFYIDCLFFDRPYLNYANHVTKINSTKPVLDCYHTDIVDQVK